MTARAALCRAVLCCAVVLCCAHHLQVCGGTVLRCLTQKRDDIKNEACRKEVFYFEKMEVSNFHNDVILAAQCRADVDKFCKDVPPGDCCCCCWGCCCHVVDFSMLLAPTCAITATCADFAS
jgi:hypothetical protein